MKQIWGTAIMAMISVFSTAYVGVRVLGVARVVSNLLKTEKPEETK